MSRIATKRRNVPKPHAKKKTAVKMRTSSVPARVLNAAIIKALDDTSLISKSARDAIDNHARRLVRKATKQSAVTSFKIDLDVSRGPQLQKMNDRAEHIREEMLDLAVDLACNRASVDEGARHLLRLRDEVRMLKNQWDILAAEDL